MKDSTKNKKTNKIIVILGPTCTGKTSLALELCQRHQGEIISADSRQVYKYMDIGTGKMPVDAKEAKKSLNSSKNAHTAVIKKSDFVWNINGINVWGYDLTEPNKYFSSFDFGEFSLNKAREIISSGKKLFLTGGTGFYIDTFTGRIKPSFIEPDFEIREELSKLSVLELSEKLKELDGIVYKNIDKKNPARLIRAIEKSLSKTVEDKSDAKTLPYIDNANFIYLGLTAPRSLLYERADLWAQKIWNFGLVDETKLLLKKGYEDSPKLKGLIYKTVIEYLKGGVKEKSALERIKFDLHAYIRRQQTYFKKNQEITWFDISRESFKENIYNFVNGQAD